MKKQGHIFFREVQRFRQVWIWILVLLITALMWYMTIQQIIFGIPMGNNPAPDILLIIFWLIFGIIFPLFILVWCKLVIEVRSDGLYIRFSPFHSNYKSFTFKDILQYEVITYNSFKRFGGFGIRFNMEGETAYNISGNQGIQLQVGNSTIVVGSGKSDQLIKAMDTGENEY